MQNSFSKTNFNSNSLSFADSDLSIRQGSIKNLSNQDKYLLLLKNLLLHDHSLLYLTELHESFHMMQMPSTPKKTLSNVLGNKIRTRDTINSLNSSYTNDSINNMVNMWTDFSIKSTNNLCEESQLFPRMKDLR